MTLIPLDTTPGLWQTPNWKPETPGLHALIVGVSNYPHLHGGSAQANETYGLGQLESSARTAAAVFEWLRRDYRHAGLPVVWCQLLLAPSEEEKQVLRDKKVTHYRNPTNSGLREAIELWCGSLPTQSAPLRKSRTMFFFSGHGLQANWDPLLLPSDYLFPPNGKPVLERCVSAREMAEWMKTHPAAEHLALFDACRNEFSPLAAIGSTANSVFPRNPPGPPPRVAASMSATAPNAVAYQPPGGEFTFFGQALIEGLDGAAGAQTVHRAGGLDVEFIDLLKYVKPRVMQLLKARNEALEQTARGSLEPCDANLVVTQARQATGKPSAPVSMTKRKVRLSIGGGTAARRPIPRPVSREFAPRASMDGQARLGAYKGAWRRNAEQAQDSHFNIAVNVRRPLTALRDYSTAHRYMGHEYASGLWSDLRLHSLKSRRALNADSLRIDRVTRDEASTIVRVDTDLFSGPGGVLAAFDGGDRGLQAIPLPTDERGPVPIRLTVAFDDAQRVFRVEGRLGPSARPHYAYLWQLSQIASLASFADAAKQAKAGMLKDAVEDKTQSTTAAMAGAIILARGGKIRKVGDWTRNLMNWFPDFPDGAVLWAETLRVSMAAGVKIPFRESDPLGAMADAIGFLEKRGVPAYFMKVGRSA
jgi:hypothetical protein